MNFTTYKPPILKNVGTGGNIHQTEYILTLPRSGECYHPYNLISIILMIRITVNSTQARVRLRRVQRSTRDKNTLFRQIQDQFLIPRIRQIFASNGDGTWRPTQRPNPILRDTLRLYRSYTIRGAPGNVYRRVGNRYQSQLVWGSSIDYAEYHERGTRSIVARPVVGLIANAEGDRRVGRITDRWYQRQINRSR